MRRNGALVVAVMKDGTPAYEAKWRDSSNRQVKRRIGPAWVDREPSGGGWRKRRGRVHDGWFDERGAFAEMERLIGEHEERAAKPPGARGATFADAAAAWLEHAERVKRLKPSTLADYRYLLAPSGAVPRKRGRPIRSRVMDAFATRPLDAITTREISGFLAQLDREPTLSPRSVNKYRQVLSAIFNFACREDTFGLTRNPVAATDKRREDQPGPIDFYEPEEVLALARALRDGLHRDASRPAVSEAERHQRKLADQQDAAMVVVAAFTGLRLGELRSLRWHNVDFADAKLVVQYSRATNTNQDSAPKSGRWRVVPLADQPAAVLAELSERDRFSDPNDLVFCSPLGTHIDDSALRQRFHRAQDAAGIRRLRWHDLRHSFGSMSVRELDVISVKEFMGHAKLETTQRYLHARARRTDADRLTRAFAGRGAELVEAAQTAA